MARIVRERYFARGKQTWFLDKAEHAIDTTYEAPRVKFHVHHYFLGAKPRHRRAACDAYAEELDAGWRSDGFESIDRDTWESLVTEEAYTGWIAPFPRTGEYFLERKRDLYCAVVDGTRVTIMHGSVGHGFGELQKVLHCESPEHAAVARDSEVGFRSYRRIERSEAMSLFGRAGSPRRRVPSRRSR